MGPALGAASAWQEVLAIQAKSRHPVPISLRLLMQNGSGFGQTARLSRSATRADLVVRAGASPNCAAQQRMRSRPITSPRWSAKPRAWASKATWRPCGSGILLVDDVVTTGHTILRSKSNRINTIIFSDVSLV